MYAGAAGTATKMQYDARGLYAGSNGAYHRGGAWIPLVRNCARRGAFLQPFILGILRILRLLR